MVARTTQYNKHTGPRISENLPGSGDQQSGLSGLHEGNLLSTLAKYHGNKDARLLMTKLTSEFDEILINSCKLQL